MTWHAVVLVVFALPMLAMGCANDLTHNSAERILDEHLESTVPTLVDSFKAHVGVSAILSRVSSTAKCDSGCSSRLGLIQAAQP